MTAKMIDGKATSERIRAEIKEEVSAMLAAGRQAPGLATVLVGGKRCLAGVCTHEAKSLC